MHIESTGNPVQRLSWRGLVLAVLLAAFCPSHSAVAASAVPTRLPQTENEKEVFNAIRHNQFQAAINALLKAPEGKRVAIAELADEHGMTALHWAVSNRNASGMRWLLDKQVELELKDDRGRTPLKIALENQDTRAMTMLINRGASATVALPGNDEKLKSLKKTDDVVDYLIWAAAVAATDTPAAAASLYQKACSTAQPITCLKLGARHDRGDGVPKDKAKSAELYRTACDADAATVEACHWLAWLHMKGEGVPKDAAKAVALYTKACDSGYWNSCNMLALFYYEGKELAKDEAKAVALFSKACDGWIVRACTDLGYLYRNGQGVTKDVSKAMAFYRKACAKAEPNACLSLGLMYRRGEDVPKDPAKAAPLFSSGCDAGDAQSCHNIASMHTLGEGMPKDGAKAVALYQKACDKKYAASCTMLGGYYYLGQNLPKDWTKAAAHYERGCNGDHAGACYMLGMLYRHGEGVTLDQAKSETLLTKACKLGEQKACAQQSAAVAAPATPTPAGAKPAAEACKLVRVTLGVDTVASVERDVKARGGSPNTGGTGSVGKFRMSAMNGDYADAGPGVMAVNYDFAASDPAGKLIGITISRHVQFGAPYAKLAADRKASLATVFGDLKSKSATESTALRSGCTLSLHENPDGGWLYEVYQLAK